MRMSEVVLPKFTAGMAALAVATATVPVVEAVSQAPSSVVVHFDTELTARASLMDILGDMGIRDLVQGFDNPDAPWFPLAILTEGTFETLLLPVIVAVGAPLSLLTGGGGLVDALGSLTQYPQAIGTMFDGLSDWYATHNPFTGALIEDSDGAFNLFDMSTWGNLLGGTSGSFDLFDPSTWGLGGTDGAFNLFDMSTWGSLFDISAWGLGGTDGTFDLFDPSTWSGLLGDTSGAFDLFDPSTWGLDASGGTFDLFDPAMWGDLGGLFDPSTWFGDIFA